MEHLILKVLTFDVAVPTTNWFCDDFLKSCDADEKLKALTMVRQTSLALVKMSLELRNRSALAVYC